MTNRNRKNNSWLTKSDKYQRLFMASVVLFIISIVLLATSFIVLKRKDRQPQSAQPQKSVQVGREITSGDVAIKIVDFQVNHGEGRFTAPVGKEYIIIKIDIKNRSDHPINILPINDTYLKDSTGNVYYEAPYTLDSPFRSGELSPGEEIRGDLSYLVPMDTSLKYYVDAIWSGSVVSFLLK